MALCGVWGCTGPSKSVGIEDGSVGIEDGFADRATEAEARDSLPEAPDTLPTELEATDTLVTDTQTTDVPAKDIPSAEVSDLVAVLPDGLHGQAPPYDQPLESLAQVFDQSGEPVGVDQLRGSWMVLWFFPKAATFG